MYYALYRKYRPQQFSDVVGQKNIIKTLQNSIKNNHFSHAYIFFGPRGIGKTTISKIFARSVNCLEPIDGNACGKCKNCLHSFEKECVDIIEIDAASNNGVDEIRDLRNNISLVPAELKYKVYIIDEVHMLSIGAFNALLKTLEEPPEHAIFILATTDPQKVPETIISRCQCFSFNRISSDMVVERLKYVCNEENILIDADVINEIAISCDGGMRDALGTLDKLSSYTSETITINDYIELNGLVTKKQISEFCDAIFDKNVVEILNFINKNNNDGKNLIQILSQVMYYLRNLLINYYIKNENLSYDILNVQRLINLINDKMFDIKKSGNPKVYIEMLFLKFIEEDDSSVLSKKEDNIITKKTYVREEKKNIKPSKTVDIYEKKPIVEEHNVKKEKIALSIETNKIKNIDEIIKIRINNTLAGANKESLKNYMNKNKILNDYTFDQDIGYLVCEILDAKFRVASDYLIIISYEYPSMVTQNLNNINKLSEVYNKLTNSNIKFAIISDTEWDTIKNEYISNLKDGVTYEIKEEPSEILEEEVKNDIITNSAVELFGDIVEIQE